MGSMCHAMHIDEVRSCVFFYLNSHTCVMPQNTQSPSQPKHTHCETNCFSIKLPNLVKLCKLMVIRLSIIAPISTPLRVSKIGIQTHFFITYMCTLIHCWLSMVVTLSAFKEKNLDFYTIVSMFSNTTSCIYLLPFPAH